MRRHTTMTLRHRSATRAAAAAAAASMKQQDDGGGSRRWSSKSDVRIRSSQLLPRSLRPCLRPSPLFPRRSTVPVLVAKFCYPPLSSLFPFTPRLSLAFSLSRRPAQLALMQQQRRRLWRQRKEKDRERERKRAESLDGRDDDSRCSCPCLPCDRTGTAFLPCLVHAERHTRSR